MALERLRQGDNVGIVAYPEGLAFLDIDVDAGKTKLPADKVTELIEHHDTFTVKTRNGGVQLYFVNTGIGKLVDLYYDDVDIGELRARGAYVVAAGSYVAPDNKATSEATGNYTVIRDVPLKPLTLNDIPEWIRLGSTKTSPKSLEKMEKKITHGLAKIGTEPVDADSIKNLFGMTLNEVRKGDSVYCKELDEFLKGAEFKGKYSSRSHADFRMVKILWKYWFTDEDIALILRHFRPYEKTLRNDYILRTISKAIEDAKERMWTREVTINDRPRPLTSIACRLLNSLPENLPEWIFTLIRGNPRIGKTHWSIIQLLKRPHGVFLSHRHSILWHAIGILKGLDAGRTAVLLIGKDASCNQKGDQKGRCNTCEKRIRSADNREEGIPVDKYFAKSSALLDEKVVLTPKDVPADLCPFHTLRFAEEKADFCFTVPYFLVNEDPSVEIKPRDLLIIDEDPTLDYFYPKTVALAEYHKKHGEVSNARNFVSDFLPILAELEKKILSQDKKHKYDTEILQLIKLVRDKINPLIEGLIENPSDLTKEGLIEKLSTSFVYTVDDKDRYKVLRRVKEHLRGMAVGSDISLADLIEPILFPAQNTFIWLGRNPNTLYLVGERTIIRSPKYNQLVVIGSTNGELFLEELCSGSRNEVEILDIAAFPYTENFIIFRLAGEIKRDENTMMNTVIKQLVESNRNRDDPVPTLILTSSKKNQQRVWDRLQSGAFMSRDETESQQVTNWTTSKANIFTTNSGISRGIDLPFYDVLLIHSCTFAQPFWESVIQHAQEMHEDAKEYRARDILARLIRDELTNSALRHSPVPDAREEQVKIIVVKSRDFDKIDKKVTMGMLVIDVGKDATGKLVAALPDMATRVSLSSVLEKIGFYEVYPSSPKYIKNNLERPTQKDTAIVLGKSHGEAKAVFESGLLASVDAGIPSKKKDLELRNKILKYPSFAVGCRAQRSAIIKWIRKRDPTISASAVKRELRRMMIDGILRSEIGKQNHIIYSLCRRDSGQSMLPIPTETDIAPTLCSGAVMVCALDGEGRGGV